MMNEFNDPPQTAPENLRPADRALESPASTAGEAPAVTEGTVPPAGDGHSDGAWRSEAGRKGGRRVHQLIRHGLLYEQEHGLKRGRQRLRQLIQEGKLYEQEHGMRPARRTRDGMPRMGSEQLLRALFHVLERLAKPAYRDKLAQVVQALEPHEEKAGGA
jgi:hypothetical protein